MATMTVSLPEPMKTWIEEQVKKGDFASTSDFIRNAVRHERERLEPNYPITLEELRDMIAEGDRSGVSTKTIEEIFEDAQRILAERHGRVA